MPDNTEEYILIVIVSYTDARGTAEVVNSTATAAIANVNDAPVGSLTFTPGIPVAGRPLTVDATNITDADGLGAFRYQWEQSKNGVNWSRIPGATSASFIPTSNQNDQRLRVLGTYIDGQGTREYVISTPSVPATTRNSAPTALNLSSLTINENVSAGTVVGTLSSRDPDAGERFTYRLMNGSDSDRFTIVGNQLRVAKSPNFEAKRNYNITIQTFDFSGANLSRPFTIRVNDLNEAPTALTLSTATTGNAITRFNTTDPDAGDRHSYKLISGQGSTDNGSFSIVGGQLFLANSPNTLPKNNYDIRVRTTDNAGLFREKAFTIIANVDAAQAKQGITQALGTLTTAFTERLEKSSVPLLGSLGNRYTPDFIRNLSTTLTNALGSNGVVSVDRFATLLQNSLSGSSVTIDRSVTGQIEYVLDLTRSTNLGTINLAGNLNVPLLGISSAGKADVSLRGSARLTLGFNPTMGGFYINTDPSKTFFGANFNTQLTSFTGKANLGLMQLDLTNNTKNPTGVKAGFLVSLLDQDIAGAANDGDRLTLSEINRGVNWSNLYNTKLSLDPNIGLKARASLNGSRGLPSINLDLDVNWKAFKWVNGKTTTEQPTLAFNNTQLDVGSFLTGFARPVVNRVNDTVKPFRPVIDFLNKDIRMFHDAGLGGTFDANGDGRVTIVDVAGKVAGWTGARINTATVTRFMNAIQAFDAAAKALNAISTSEGNITLDLGSYNIGAINPNGSSNSLATRSATRSRRARSADTQTSSSSKVKQFLDAVNRVEGLGFPILTDPNTAIKLLLGQNATLFKYDMPDLAFDFSLNRGFSLLGAIDVGLRGSFSANTNLSFGYDTFGLNQWKDSNFSTSALSRLIDGFYIEDKPGDELILRAGISGGARVRWVGSASAGVQGTVGIDLVDVNEFALNPNWERDSRQADAFLLESIRNGQLPSELRGRDNENLFYTASAFVRGRTSSVRDISFFGTNVGEELLDNYLRLKGITQTSNQSDGKIRSTEFTSRLSRPLDLFNINGKIDAYINVDTWAYGFNRRWNLASFSVGGTSFSSNGTSSQKYISGATIFLDANFNGQQDDTEPFAITNAKGKYELKIPMERFDTNKNGRIDTAEGQLISVGGFDIFTKQEMKAPLIAPAGYRMITPLTTLVSQMMKQNDSLQPLTPAQAQARVKQALGLPTTVNLATFDPIAAMASGNANGAKVMAAHMTVQTLVEQISSMTVALAASSPLPLDGLVAGIIAQQLKSGAVLNLANPNQISAVLEAAIATMEVLTPGPTWQQVRSIADTAAQVMAVGVRRMQAILNNPTLKTPADFEAALRRVSAIQSVLLTQTAQALQAAAQGKKSIASVLAENTGAALNKAIADANAILNPVPINGNVGNNLINGTASPDLILGFSGNDTLNGGGNLDRMSGGDGNDVLNGGSGDDQLLGDAGRDRLFGGAGNDRIMGGDDIDYLDGGSGNDSLFGGNGADQLLGGDNNDFLSGDRGNDVLYGGTGDDLLDGGIDHDRLFGGVGNDQLLGELGNDILHGEGGNDLVRGGLGNDRIFGGNGNDTLYGEENNDAIQGGAGDDLIVGGLGKDTLLGEGGNDLIQGGGNNDQIFGGAGNDTLTGEAGDDLIRGGLGQDVLIGGNGNDTLRGDAGRDVLISAGGGRDILTGGQGADTFAFIGSNRVDALAQSRLNEMDEITGINFGGGDRILLSFTNDRSATNQPTGLFNAGSVRGVNLTQATAAAFADKNQAVAGRQALRANEAVFYSWQGITYLGVNNGNAAFNAQPDFVVKLSTVNYAAPGAANAGALDVSNYFA